MDKIEKMFLDLNSVLVKFWKDQGRPDKEIKIALLERMLNWYKKMGYITIDTLSEEPDKSLEEAAEEKYPVYWKSYPKDGIVRSESSYDTNKQCREAFIAGAEWQKEQDNYDTIFYKGMMYYRKRMMEEAVEGYVNYYEDSGGILMAEAQVGCPYHNGDKVRIIVVKVEEEKK